MKYNISINAVQYAVQHLPYQRLALLTGLDQSAFSHYRHGRSVVDNMDVKNLHELTKECIRLGYTVDMSDMIVIDSRKIDEARALLEAVYPRLTIARTNARLTLLGATPLEKNAISKMQAALQAQALTLAHYAHIVYVTRMMKKALSINDDKLLENLREVLKATGVAQYQLSTRVSEHANYISRQLYRHKLGECPISELSPMVWQQIANAIYPNRKNNVQLLQNQVLREARRKSI